MDLNESVSLSIFVERFLRNNNYRGFINDYDLYFGELMHSALNGLEHYKEDGGASKTTYIYHCIKNQFIKVHKREQEWYKWHTSCGFLEQYPAKTQKPALIAETNELIKRIKDSDLSPRAQQAIIYYLSYPLRTLEELGAELGVSKQGAHQLLNSAKQYLERRFIYVE